jgi:NAD(P)H-dependent FMN reductase
VTADAGDARAQAGLEAGAGLQAEAKLMIVIASTRPGRVGLPVAQWVVERAAGHGAFVLDVVDLAELGLPFLDEPNHPRLRSYTKAHTWAWSARVDAADAFVFVIPEYNHGMNAPLKNALDFVFQEWAHKPAGIVAYGGIAAGARAAGQLRQVLLGLRVTPLFEAVYIPFVAQRLDDDGRFLADDQLDRAATLMLDELRRHAACMRCLRDEPRAEA